jgi:hypothetical protein
MAVEEMGGLSLFDALSLREPLAKRDRPATWERFALAPTAFIADGA